MLEIRRVLHPTDFSEGAGRALPHAIHLARAHGAELHLLHVLVLQQLESERPAGRFPAEEELLRLLEADGAPSAREVDVRVVRSVRRGCSAAREIAEYVSEQRIDLVVMGSHGWRGLRRLVLGSVADRVVSLAGCPALVVRPGAGTERFGRILVPFDFSDASSLALAHARELASLWRARLRLLHVVPRLTYPGFYVQIADLDFDVWALRRAATERLQRLADNVRTGSGGPVEVEVRVGRAAVEIEASAKDLRADLIVMASQGLSGLERVLLGSVTEKVLRSGESSVLVVKPFGRRLIPRPFSEEATARPATDPAVTGEQQ